MTPVPHPGDPPVNEGLALALGLTAKEYRVILRVLKRIPTYSELGMYSVMWSEHCSYKHSRRILKCYPTKGRDVLQGPGENAGGVRVDRNLAVLMKIESHNHPSMVEPYQGAATGVGGILRDIFTMGARPIALMDSLRFGPLTDAVSRKVFAGVVSGIGGYGNCIGVPTVGGELEFDPCYAHNCLVNALAVGVIDPRHLTRGRASGPGNLVVYMGAPTGRDGIHGASLLASRGFGGRTGQKRGGGISAVQVADPFLGKLLMEASIELCRRKLLVGMQDMGAAGLTCSTCEMSAKGGVGMEVILDRVPLRAHGMTPYEILLSESQERMLLVVTRRQLPAVRAVVNKFRIPLAVIGAVRRGGRVRMWKRNRLIVDLPARSLTDDVPLCPLPRPARGSRAPRTRTVVAVVNALAAARRPAEALLRLLASPTLGSKRFVWQQYDHMVRTNAVLLPGSDAAVLRLKGSRKLIAFSVDGPSRLCAADAHVGGQLAIAESARNVSCAGARPVAFTNGLNFPDPDRPGNLWQFAQVVRGIAVGARQLRIPVVSGNVSFYNEYRGRGIDPTPMVGVMGVLDGWHPVPQWFRREGDVVVWLGPWRGSLGASALDTLGGARARRGRPLPVSWRVELAVQRCLVHAAAQGLLSSAHDCSDGGFLVALAECCASSADADEPTWGCEINLNGSTGLLADLFFGEAPSRVLVSLPETALARFGRLARGIPWRMIGRVTGDICAVRVRGKECLKLPVSRMTEARERPFRSGVI